MPTFDIRVGDLEKSSPLPEGTYRVRCDKFDYYEPEPGAVSKYTGKPAQPYFRAEFTVTDPEEALGRKVFQNFTLAPNGRFLLRSFCEDGLGKPEDWKLDTDEIIGAEALAVIGIEIGKGEYVGRDRNNIKKFLPLL